MKKHLFLLFVVCSMTGNAQNLTPDLVENVELNNFAGSIMEYKFHNLKNNSIRTIILENPEEPSISEETHEVSQDLYISMCDDGEGANCNLYLVKDINVNITIERVYEDAKNIYIDIKSGSYDKRENLTIALPL